MGSYSCSVSPLDCTAGAGIASADEVCDDAGKVIKAELSVLLADAEEAWGSWDFEARVSPPPYDRTSDETEVRRR